jgi:hypothetical protein
MIGREFRPLKGAAGMECAGCGTVMSLSVSLPARQQMDR